MIGKQVEKATESLDLRGAAFVQPIGRCLNPSPCFPGANAKNGTQANKK